MSSHEPQPGDADAAPTVSRNHVVVTGAGFTRALVPGAPLLVDDVNNDVLEGRVRGLPNASRLLDWERNLHPRGYIDIERLMTRLDALMPYDSAENAATQAESIILHTWRRNGIGRHWEPTWLCAAGGGHDRRSGPAPFGRSEYVANIVRTGRQLRRRL